jgi:thiamine biosynthesis lipoprotein
MRPLLGTFVTIRAEEAPSLTPEQLESAVSGAFRAIEHIERLMSFHRSNSDIGRLNRAQPGCHLRVHRWTYIVLREALRLNEASGGAFDCNIGGVLVRAGLLPRSRATAARCHQPMRKAITLTNNGHVRLNRRVSLDLGGIAKGFAVDQAVRILRDHGVRSGLVNAGGDLRVFGAKPQAVWVRCPTAPGEQRLIGHLRNGAVATSASYFVRVARSDSVAASAIVNAVRERQLDLSGSISVIAKTCMQADALTKVAALQRRVPVALRLRSQAKVIEL